MGEFNPKQLQELLQQAQKQARDLQARMLQTVVEASAGGGSVTVRMTGAKQVISVTIDPDAANDVEMLQDLVTAAVNDALNASRELAETKMAAVTGGLRLPGM